MHQEYKKILMCYFYDGQHDLVELADYKMPDDKLVNEALDHYYNCKKATCEMCHVARMFHCKIKKGKFIKYKILREHLCYSKRQLQNLSHTMDMTCYKYIIARQTLENSRIMYVMFLKNVFKKWQRIINKNKNIGCYHCSICLNDNTDHVVFNCGHGTCSDCLENIEVLNNQCPICRELIHVHIPMHA